MRGARAVSTHDQGNVKPVGTDLSAMHAPEAVYGGPWDALWEKFAAGRPIFTL
jgi:hypothetical protein